MTFEQPEWERREVQALIDAKVLVITDGYRAKNSELGEEGLPFARAGNVNSGFQLDQADLLRRDHVKQAGIKRSRPGDVVFTSKGTVGRFAYVQSSTAEFVYSPQLCFWRVLDPSVLDPRFVYYWMHGRECQSQFNAAKGSTDMADYISLRDQRAMWITFPPVEEQRRIAWILGSLDDKIESNVRLANTLEQIGATLFKAWFVDFVGHEDLVESKIGPIPRGWELDSLGNQVQTTLGGTPSRKAPRYWTDGTVPWINSGKVNEFRIVQPTALITEEGLRKSAAKLMPPGTVVLAITGATLGQVSRLEIASSANQSVVGVLGNEHLPDEYLYFWLHERMPFLLSRQTGAAQQHVNKGDVNELLVLIPPTNVLDEFARVAQPLFRRTAAALFQSQRLESIRDALLPRLVSSRHSAEPGV